MTGAPKRPPPRRARETRAPLADYAGEILVVCPRCAGPAILKRRDSAERGAAAQHRLVCRRCGHLQEGAGRRRAQAERAGRDPFLGLPLWLATPCCGEILWAFNA